MKFLAALIFFHIAVSLGTLVGPMWWFVEISRNAGNYHLAAHGVELGLLIVLRSRLSRFRLRFVAMLLTVLCLAYIRPIVPFYIPPPAVVATDSASLRLLSMNVEFGCCDASSVASYVRDQTPDLLVIIEGGTEFFDAFPLKNEYAHVREVRRSDPFAMAVYSRFPIAWEDIHFEEPELPPVLFGTLEHPSGASIHLGVFHANPPVSSEALRLNNLLVRRITNRVRHLEGRTLLIGDLNATPHSSFYQRLVVNAEVRHAFAGEGWYSSWHARQPLLRFPIDHIWTKGSISVRRASRLAPMGADHFPLAVDLAL